MNTPIWDEGNWPGLPDLEGQIQADVCVVGLGGSGLAAVQRLLELGQNAVGIDAGLVAGAAAGRNGGFLLAGLSEFYHDVVGVYGRELARESYRATLEQVGRMGQETPSAIGMVGSLRLAESDEEISDCHNHLQALRADGFAAEHYDGPEGRGILIPYGGAFNPMLRVRLLAQQLLQQGARLFEQSAALAIQGDRVTTPKGQVLCKKVVVAVDGKLERLLPELVGKARTARLQMLGTAPAPEVNIVRPVYARFGFDYWQQLPDGRVAMGGCRDAYTLEEWTDSNQPTQQIQQAIEKKLRSIGVQAPVTHRWAASVCYTSSGMPILEEVRPGVWAAGAYSGTGNVVGAICGQEAAQLAVTGKVSAGREWLLAMSNER